jgi:predicted Fe-Mo cluster-binding NifX family protein
MKVCIPVMGQNARLMCLLANDFYKADYYCLYDLLRDETEYFSKSDLMVRFGLDLRKQDGEDTISAIISPNMRPMAYKILRDNQITVFRPESNLLEENIERLQRGLLLPYDPANIENTSSCGTSCSACSSSCST